MELNSNEYVVRRERLHKGIFCLPGLLFALPLIPLIALTFFISYAQQKTSEAFQQMGAQQNISALIYLPVIIVAIPWLLAFLVVFVATLMAYLKSEITLTNKRLLFRTGFILRVSGELPLENIEAIFLVEPLLGRILGFGTILLTSVGGGRFPLRYIGQPQILHVSLQNAAAIAKAPRATVKPPAPTADGNSRFMPKG